MSMEKNAPMENAGMASDDEMQRRYYEEGKVYRLQIESTLSCPGRCDFCYAGSEPDSRDGMESEKIIELLEIAARTGVKVIDWLGGDPLVRTGWYELCKRANDLGLINNLWSSGIPLAHKSVAKRAVEVTAGGFISVHVDSLDPSHYAMVHGSRGKHAEVRNIDRILRGIRNCLDAGKDPGAMVNCITFTRFLGDGDAKTTIQRVHHEFGLKTCLTLYKPAAQPVEGTTCEDWQPTGEQVKDTYKFRDALYPDDPSVGAMDVTKFYCGSMVCVKADGRLAPCSVINTKEFGNVHDEPLDVLIDKHRQRLLFLDFRNPATMSEGCRDCMSNTVCFGCRSNAFYYAGDVCGADPMCQSYRSEKNSVNDISKKTA